MIRQHRLVGSQSVCALGLGVGRVTEANAREAGRLLSAAVEHGITYFDISNRPESTERLVGAALRPHRDSVTLATKFGSRPRPGVLACATPAYIRAAAEQSLRNLGTDRIDLYYLHRPDPDTPIAETLGALDELVRAGKIRQIACSKFSARQLREAHRAAGDGARFVAVENHCSLLHADDEDDVLPLCAELGIAYMPYWPLAAGLLTGKYRRGRPPPDGSRFATDRKWQPREGDWLNDRNYDLIDRLTAWAAAHGHSLPELAFGWLLAHRQVGSVIAGASSPGQLSANVAAASAWALSPAELAEVTAMVRPGEG
jgi:aryl-alcohol dehydrogenase-like predicted oxidoreductase